MQIHKKLWDGLARTRKNLIEGLGLGTADSMPDWDHVEETLLGADVGMPATTEILGAIREAKGEDFQKKLRETLLSMLDWEGGDFAQERKSAGPKVTLVAGVNGVGKTTTVAKLAHRSIASGRTVVVVGADTFRAAAREQLQTWATRVGALFVQGEHASDPASVVHNGIQTALSRKADEVLIDTAGRLHTKRPLMDELAKVKRVAAGLVEGAPHETLLVVDSTVGGNGLLQAKQFHESLSVDGIVLTKLDGTAKGGVVLAVKRELGVPVLYTGVGEGLADLLPFAPHEFVDALLRV